MDGLSVAASVGGIASLGFTLSKALYIVYCDIEGAEKETEEIANNISLLSTVLKALEGVLRKETQTYNIEFVTQVNDISQRCDSIFKDIAKVTGVKRGKESFLRKVAWCFQKDRAKMLQTSLESLKSTLNLLLHLISLARAIVGVATRGGATNAAGDREVTEEKHLLTTLIMQNRTLLERLDSMEIQARKERQYLERRPLEGQEPPVSIHERIPLPFEGDESAHATEQESTQEGKSPIDGRVDEKDHDDGRPRRHTENEGKNTSLGGPPELLPQDRHSKNQKTPQYAASAQDEIVSDQNATNEVDVPLSQQPLSRTENAVLEKDPERVTAAEAYGLLHGFHYRNPTSHLLRNVIPHEIQHDYFSLRSSMGRDRAEQIVDDLLGHYTCVSVERHQTVTYYEPEQSRGGRRIEEPLDVYHGSPPWARNAYEPVYRYPNTPYDLPDPQWARSRMYHEAGTEMIPRGLVHVDDMMQKMSFQQVEYYKLQEHNKNLEQELRIERLKEQVRQETLNSIKAEQQKETESRAAIENSKPIILKDWLGRSFSLPIQACRSWQTMRSLITSSFLHIDDLGPQIAQGNYDLLGPGGAIVLPDVWEEMVKPGWIVELRLRPQSDPREKVATPRSSTQTSSLSSSRDVGTSRRFSLRKWLPGSRSSKDVINDE